MYCSQFRTWMKLLLYHNIYIFLPLELTSVAWEAEVHEKMQITAEITNYFQ